MTAAADRFAGVLGDSRGGAGNARWSTYGPNHEQVDAFLRAVTHLTGRGLDLMDTNLSDRRQAAETAAWAAANRHELTGEYEQLLGFVRDRVGLLRFGAQDTLCLAAVAVLLSPFLHADDFDALTEAARRHLPDLDALTQQGRPVR